MEPVREQLLAEVGKDNKEPAFAGSLRAAEGQRRAATLKEWEKKRDFS